LGLRADFANRGLAQGSERTAESLTLPAKPRDKTTVTNPTWPSHRNDVLRPVRHNFYQCSSSTRGRSGRQTQQGVLHCPASGLLLVIAMQYVSINPQNPRWRATGDNVGVYTGSDRRKRSIHQQTVVLARADREAARREKDDITRSPAAGSASVGQQSVSQPAIGHWSERRHRCGGGRRHREEASDPKRL